MLIGDWMKSSFTGVRFWFRFTLLLSAGLFLLINISWLLDVDRKRAILFIEESDSLRGKVGEVEKIRLWKSLEYYGDNSKPGYKKMFFAIKGRKGKAQVIIIFKGEESARNIDLKVLE